MRKEKKAFYAEVFEGDFAERIRKINDEKGFKFKKEVIEFLLELGVNSYFNESKQQNIDEYYEELKDKEKKINKQEQDIEDKIMQMSNEDKHKFEEKLDEEIEMLDNIQNNIKKYAKSKDKEIVNKAKNNIQNILKKMDEEEIKLKQEQMSKEHLNKIKDTAKKVKNYKEQEIIFTDEGNREDEWVKQEIELQKIQEIQNKMYKLFKDFEEEMYRNKRKKNKKDYKEANYKTFLKYVNDLKELQIENGERVCNICKFHEEGFDCICKKKNNLHDIGCEDMTNNVQGICEAWRE